MDAGVMLFSGAAFVLIGLALVGGPVILVDWLRRRRETAIERQIALTDALDGRLGAMVAPVVTRPFFGPWEIRIAVPLRRSATVARILSVVDEVFRGFDGASSRPYRLYRLFLSPAPDSPRETRAPRSPERWARGRVVAA